MQTENKMGTMKVTRLIWQLGLPMILSMVLQALYNVVDTVFVINMSEDGALGNLALSAAFPIQILMIAIGVGTGVGINALLSKSLGEKNFETANRVAGNGLFLGVIFFLIFFLFGLFGVSPYMHLMAQDEKVIKMGITYLRICSCLSVGSILYAVVERFLMATGKTTDSMICQITGAVLNILLDWVFIYPCQMGIAGAAYATIIGQIVSLLLGLVIHYTKNKEINGNPKYIKPAWRIIKGIYRIGFPAFLMQAMLSLMMFGVLLILQTIPDRHANDLMTGAFGIYYKLMQTALFASFGLSNALISMVSYNDGMGDVKRIRALVFWGIIDSLLVALIITAIYEILAPYISSLFALTITESGTLKKSEIISCCTTALRIASIGYVFMAFSVAIQGILQGLSRVYSPLIISFLRLIVFVLPTAYLLTLVGDVTFWFWWTFPIAEFLTAIASFFFLKYGEKKIFLAEKNDAF